MARVYDNWEKLIGAVLQREELRRLAYCESFSSLSVSTDFSSRFSFSSAIEDAPPDPSTRGIFFSRNLMAIEYKEVKNATNNFRADTLLGEGVFGRVYKGWVDEHTLTASKPGSGIPVAVKRLDKQGDKVWSKDINYLSQLRHVNLIKLIGYCLVEDNRISVYEFMPNGSLSYNLFTRRDQTLSWAVRIEVAMGTARGLSFLHGLAIPVIHRDVNSSVILLDGEFNAKLSDFGLARDGPPGDQAHVTTQVVGTYGYAAPEYMATGHLTTKCDVYGFGVVLLELLSGRRAIDQNRATKEQNLVEWAKPYLGEKRKVLRIVDNKLQGQCPLSAAYKVAKLASHCLSSDPKLRPRMDEVVVSLQQLQCPKST